MNTNLKGILIMTLAGYMFNQFSTVQYAEFMLRILISCLCGAAIGFERSLRFKEAGIRTHMIVCCASALIMIVSKYGFVDLTTAAGAIFNGSRGADPARIAAQVVSGISFLGAGIIFRNGTSIRGLTTAAGIWATAGIGLANGGGLYVIGIFGTLLIAVVQIVLHKYQISADSQVIGHVHCRALRTTDFRNHMNSFIGKNNMTILSSGIAYNEDETVTYDFTLRMSSSMTNNDLFEFLESIEGIREIRCELGR